MITANLFRSRKTRQQKLRRLANFTGARHLRFETLEERKVLATYVVTTTADTPCLVTPPLINPLFPDEFDATTLRCAMDTANANAGHDLIKFNIPAAGPGYNGEWWTITLTPLVPLPPISDPAGVEINGFTQPEAGNDVGPYVNLVGTGGKVAHRETQSARMLFSRTKWASPSISKTS